MGKNLKISEVLARGVDVIYPSAKGLEKLLKSKKIKLYCGYDPTGPFLHLGHLVTFLKLSQFQKLGHEVIMLIGDFTGMIGDPDKEEVRKKLSRSEVKNNFKNYQKVAGKFLRFSGNNSAKVLFNSKWNDRLALGDVIELASHFTVQQMLARDMFQERISKKKPIYLHEFLYPLIQGYDSVVMGVDLEVGGKDQLFNMMCGRDLMKDLKRKEKFVLGMKLLTDPTGKKMGKTEGDLISLTEEPKSMYGKIMAWPDEFISLGMDLFTEIPIRKIKKTEEQIKKGKINPMEAKSLLAREIVSLCHSPKKAVEAEEEFKRVFGKKEAPSSMPTIKIRKKRINILDLLIESGLVKSKMEAKRLIQQNGVKVNSEVQKDWKKEIEVKKGIVIQVGKRKFAKIG